MEAGLKQTILLKRKRNLLKLLPKWKLIGEKSTAEILLKLRPDLRKILVNESGIFYKINIIFCAELSATNCRAELSNAELSAPNCPRRIVRAELSCAELSGHPIICPRHPYPSPFGLSTGYKSVASSRTSTPIHVFVKLTALNLNDTRRDSFNPYSEHFWTNFQTISDSTKRS